jgi:catechol 2,3-dioxygenase-like lactoylglutathione lyase family enzyme
MTRRFRLSFTLILLALVGGPVQAQPEAPKAHIQGVHSIGITVSDLDRSIEFYSKVLSFEKVSDMEVWGEEYERLYGVFGLRMRVVTLRLGQELLELTEFLVPRGRPMPRDSRGNDHWFQHIAIIATDMDRAYDWLRKHKVEHASTGPQRLPDWNKNAGGIRAFYFKDPDGHFLELLQFPPDKGDRRWHRKTDQLFLGIDHTAIVVADTDLSLKFYRDHLGFKVTGESENHGPEQERLNNVFGARLRITTLRAAKGPAIEFLEYLSPRDGRKMQADTMANDLWHWHIRLQTRRLDEIPLLLRPLNARITSGDVVAFADDRLRFQRGYVAADPDGHALLFTEAKKGPNHD